jgi:hypothetical protein
MILGSEWTAFHLTPTGWVEGDKQREFAPLLSRMAPTDRVLSVVNKVSIPQHGTDEVVQKEVWRVDDNELVKNLLAEFGPAPNGL